MPERQHLKVLSARLATFLSKVPAKTKRQSFYTGKVLTLLCIYTVKGGSNWSSERTSESTRGSVVCRRLDRFIGSTQPSIGALVSLGYPGNDNNLVSIHDGVDHTKTTHPDTIRSLGCVSHRPTALRSRVFGEFLEHHYYSGLVFSGQPGHCLLHPLANLNAIGHAVPRLAPRSSAPRRSSLPVHILPMPHALLGRLPAPPIIPGQTD
jgi:hypothetical protein